MLLMHGDCLEEMKKIPSGSVDLVLTDPPYGTIKNIPIEGYVQNKTNTSWDTTIDFEQMFFSDQPGFEGRWSLCPICPGAIYKRLDQVSREPGG